MVGLQRVKNKNENKQKNLTIFVLYLLCSINLTLPYKIYRTLKKVPVLPLTSGETKTVTRFPSTFYGMKAAEVGIS